MDEDYLMLDEADSGAWNVSPAMMYPTNTSLQNPDTPAHHVIDTIQIWVTPFLVVFGCTGNILSIWVLHSSKFRALSSSVYLAALAASDTAFLLQLSLVWLNVVGFNTYNRWGFCQGVQYISYCSTFLSVWSVVAFTVERFISVCYPLLRAAICTVHRARAIIAVMVVMALLLYGYVLAATTIVYEPYRHRDMCTIQVSYIHLWHTMNHVDLVLTLIVPIIIIVVLNVLIVRRVCHVEQLRHNLINTISNYSTSPVPSITPLTTTIHTDSPNTDSSRWSGPQGKHLYVEITNSIRSSSQGPSNSRVRNQKKVTKMLLIISTVFIALNMPSYVMRALQLFWVRRESL